jgi:hypothetical protein
VVTYSPRDDPDLTVNARTTPAVPRTITRTTDDAPNHTSFLPSVPQNPTANPDGIAR